MTTQILAIVIPAYNEAHSIQKVIQGIPSHILGYTRIKKIVIDDGSSDDTGKLAQLAGAYVARHRINLGVGGATATGFAAAKKLGADATVTIDGDAQHNPLDIAKVLQPIVNGTADMVVGTRLNLTGSMPLVRVIGNRLFNLITWLLYKVKTTDSQSGFRAYNKKALGCLDIRTSGYEVCTELFGEAKAKKLRIQEVPIETIYTDHSRQKGQPAVNGVNILLKLITKKLVG